MLRHVVLLALVPAVLTPTVAAGSVGMISGGGEVAVTREGPAVITSIPQMPR